jgi:uncharacterized repeat protein (TIGR03803 family)
MKKITTALVMVLTAVGLVAQAPTPAATLPLTVLHTFDPPDSPGYPELITAASDGSAFIQTTSPGRILRITATGAATILHRFAIHEFPQAALVPVMGGGYLGLTENLAPDNYGQVFRIESDGSFETVYAFGPSDPGHATEMRRGPDGTVYVTVESVGQSPFRVLLVRPDGGIVPNAFTVPGPVLAIAADGTVYGMLERCAGICGQELFRRLPDGTVSSLYGWNASKYLALSDLAITGAGVLVGVVPFGDLDENFRIGTAFEVLHRFSSKAPNSPCHGRLRSDMAGGLVGLAGRDVFRVSAAGDYAPVRLLDVANSVDLAQMPNGTSWVTVTGGGAFVSPCAPYATAVVEVTGGSTPRVVASFANGNTEGTFPTGPFVLDADRSVYGTASRGGPYDAGTIFRVSSTGAFRRLYTFSCGSDGGHPTGLVETANGALFGTTTIGTTHAGTVFRVGRSGNLTTLFVFRRWEDGAEPGPLVAARDGYLYGWTRRGGRLGGGTAFRISAEGAFAVLHDFGPADGLVGIPTGALLAASDGNFYGTTGDCNIMRCVPGSLFRMTPGGNVTVLAATQEVRYGSILIEGPDRRIYGSDLWSESAFAVTTEGVFTRLGGAAELQFLGADGLFYGVRRSSGAMFRMTRSGSTTDIALAGPSVYTGTLRDGFDADVYGVGLLAMYPNSGVVYRVPRPGPDPPKNFRIVR